MVRISIAEHAFSRQFAKKCSYWRSMYRQDRLLPFAENGFGALRLAENAELFSGLLFNKGRIGWDLQADKCYINGKQQPGSGLKWAWDLFAVSQIADRECGLEWTRFDPYLNSPHPPAHANACLTGTAFVRALHSLGLCCHKWAGGYIIY